MALFPQYKFTTHSGVFFINRTCANINVQKRFHGSDWYDDATKRVQHGYTLTATVGSFVTGGSLCTTHGKGDTMAIGFDDLNGNTITKVECQILDSVSSRVYYTKTWENLSSAYETVPIGGRYFTQPIYLERLSQLQAKSRAVTRNSAFIK